MESANARNNKPAPRDIGRGPPGWVFGLGCLVALGVPLLFGVGLTVEMFAIMALSLGVIVLVCLAGMIQAMRPAPHSHTRARGRSA